MNVANAINAYIKSTGGSVNSLAINKRLTLVVRFDDPSYAMDGLSTWTSGRYTGKPGKGHMAALGSGKLEKRHFEVFLRASEHVRTKLETKRVTSFGSK